MGNAMHGAHALEGSSCFFSHVLPLSANQSRMDFPDVAKMPQTSISTFQESPESLMQHSTKHTGLSAPHHKGFLSIPHPWSSAAPLEHGCRSSSGTKPGRSSSFCSCVIESCLNHLNDRRVYVEIISLSE